VLVARLPYPCLPRLLSDTNETRAYLRVRSDGRLSRASTMAILRQNPGASYDYYDSPAPIDNAVANVTRFFRTHLAEELAA
jgi:hypothetical protein